MDQKPLFRTKYIVDLKGSPFKYIFYKKVGDVL